MRNTLLFSFLLAATLYLVNLGFSPGFNGGADSITHYQIAKYSWDHPYLLMDQWGKPVFTILLSPFAQLGFLSVNLINIALLFWGAWLSFLIGKNLNLRRSEWLPFIVLFTPIIFGNAISGLTEPICAIFLILFLYFATKEKWLIGSIIVGFMPFARSEGFVILSVIIVFYLFSKRFRYIPYLLIGTILFNTIGFFMTGKVLWIFDNNPYINTGIKVYGSGSFLHFFQESLPIFGIPFILLCLQTIFQFSKFKSIFQTHQWSRPDQIWFWLITGTFWGYFMAHTVLWWQGMWASLGLIRVMMVITVPMALLALKGWEWVEDKWLSNQRNLSFSIFLCLILSGPFVIRTMGYQEIQIHPPLGVEELVNAKLHAALINKYDMKERKTFTAHPYLNLLLDIDPFDTAINDRLHNWKTAQSGDLVVWDGHFGPNEEQVFQAELDGDSTFFVSLVIEPDEPFYTLNNLLYSIRVYEKK